jgi:hypothetical protein
VRCASGGYNIVDYGYTYQDEKIKINKIYCFVDFGDTMISSEMTATIFIFSFDEI